MLSIIQKILNIFKITLVQNTLKIYKLDYLNNRITIRQSITSKTAQDIINNNIVIGIIDKKPVLSIRKD